MLSAIHPTHLEVFRTIESTFGSQYLYELALVVECNQTREINSMRQALTAADGRAAAATAHSLGGSLAFLGAESMAERYHEIEILANEGRIDTCKIIFESLGAECERFIRGLATYSRQKKL